MNAERLPDEFKSEIFTNLSIVHCIINRSTSSVNRQSGDRCDRLFLNLNW